MDQSRPESEQDDIPSPVGSNHSSWFYIQHGETYGPVSSTDLRAAAHLGFLGPDDLVCRKDSGKWVMARMIHGLFKDAG
jgi:hypothetical protein